MKQVCLFCGKESRQDEPLQLKRSEGNRQEAHIALFRITQAGFERQRSQCPDEEQLARLDKALEILQIEKDKDRELGTLQAQMKLLNAERNSYFIALMTIKCDRSGKAATLQDLAARTLSQWRGDPFPECSIVRSSDETMDLSRLFEGESLTDPGWME